MAANNKYHATETAEDIFSPAFIENNIIASASADKFDGISMNEFLTRYFPCGYIGSAGDLRVRADRPTGYRRNIRLALGNDAFARAFHDIGFSEKVKRALDLSRQPEIGSGAVAVHLRAGDIVNDVFRLMDTFAGKVAPYRLASAFTAEQRARGKHVILFGQDDGLGRAMAKAHGALWAPDLMPQELATNSERAFFDVGLMSRCSKVVSGTSDFTQLAAAIRGRRLTRLDKYWSYSNTLKILSTPAAPAVDAAASNLQKAFSYWSAARLILWSKPKHRAGALEYLDRALELDPDNFFYTFVKAAVLYSRRDTAHADALIEYIQSVKVHGGLLFLLTNVNAPVAPYLPLLTDAARNGSTWAALCLAFDPRGSLEARKAHARKALSLPSLTPELRERLEGV
jgi:hypothetical protein